MSLGEDRVRVKFNPSDNSAVAQIKQATAHLIDMCEALGEEDDPEVNRCLTLAMDAYETAAMYAVKAATANK
jgi:hypothetical protein